MLGQNEQLPYLVFHERKKSGGCRFCHGKTRDAVHSPEISAKKIRSPIFVCSACREIGWKLESLRKLFNRKVVETIVHVSEIPVIPQIQQLNMTSLGPRWVTGLGALRVLIYFYEGQTRFLTSKYIEKLRSHQDITEHVQDLVLSIPELNETVMEGNIHDLEKGPKIILYDCLKFRGLELRDSGDSVRHQALVKVFEIIGSSESWSRVMQ